MAKQNKESLVIILDIGVDAEEFTKEAAECCLSIIKHKIYYHPSDMLSILLLRTKETYNVGNIEEPDQYKNISQVLPGSQIPTWQMVKEFSNALEKPKSKEGDWVDALIVAIGIITEDAIIHKTKLSQIVLFHNFNSPPSSLDDDIIAKLNELDFKFIIVSNNVQYAPDSSGKLIPQFKPNPDKSNAQMKNEGLVTELIESYPHTTLCNIQEAPSIILHREVKTPWSWNTTLTIGTKIEIHISGVIAIKPENKIPSFKKKLRNSNDIIGREKKYYSGVDEIGTNTEYDQVSGYMLGNTPLAYDPSLGQASSVDTKKGIHFIGFVTADNIPQEHFSGESTYMVFPQKGKQVSAKIIDSLVRVMLKTNLCILAWKVYLNGNKPKLVVLLPTLKYKIAGMCMIELSYHSQHRFWDFPKLSTKKNQPTEEQLDAVDELIAALDLSPKFDNEDCPKTFESLSNDHLPFDFLPDIQQEYLIAYLSNSIVNQNTNATTELLDVPSALKPNASIAAERIKAIFPLEAVEAPTKEKLEKHLNTAFEQEDVAVGGSTSNGTSIDDDGMITHVGTITPAEDFTTLIAYIMKNIPNGAERSAKFHHYAYQIRSVISELLFKSMIKQNEKIEKALIAYRKLTIAANSPYDYNDWMRDLRTKVIERKMFDFWQDVIVKNKLGLCMEDDSQAEEEFYCISKDVAEKTNVNDAVEDESVMDLFDMM